jgi:hypothetical protein
MRHMTLNCLIYSAFRHQPVEHQARVDSSGNYCRPPSFATCNYTCRPPFIDNDFLDRLA